LGRSLIADGRDFTAGLRLRDETRAAILARCGEPDLAYARAMSAPEAMRPA
jgi:hypothetical protein